jgi:hypothetical protein
LPILGIRSVTWLRCLAVENGSNFRPIPGPIHAPAAARMDEGEATHIYIYLYLRHPVTPKKSSIVLHTNKANEMADYDKRQSVENVEALPESKEDGIDRHLDLQMPESLRGLSTEQIAVIDKAATRKLDILLMPILLILYIL